MSTEEEKSLHFIEQIIEESLANGFPKEQLVFVFHQNQMAICTLVMLNQFVLILV
jgi:hypothetical protein